MNLARLIVCFLLLASALPADSVAESEATGRQHLRSSSSSLSSTEEEEEAHRSLAVVDVAGFRWQLVNESIDYTQRHENAFIHAGDRFYVMGGREKSETVDIYNYADDTWSQGAEFNSIIHHFQAVLYQGLIWVVGGNIDNKFPEEAPTTNVYLFDPANNAWLKGPTIPQARRRGGGGVVVYKDKFYFACGNGNGHGGEYVDYFDEFDPYLGKFTVLPSAPRARDHFHAVVMDDLLYAAGGRLSGGPGGGFTPLIPEVDVYDFASGTWSTLAANLPTPRAGTMAVNFRNHLMIMGGEGVNDAFSTTEAYDPVTQTWQTRDDMNFKRHGTQAINLGNGVVVTGGSDKRGGGRQHNMEYYGEYNPQGQPLTPGVLSVNGGSTNPLLVLPQVMGQIVIEHVSGNSGVFVTKMDFVGSFEGQFELVTDVVETAFLIGIGTTRTFAIRYLGGIGNQAAAPHAFLRILYSGGKQIQVPLRALNSNSDTLPPTPVPIPPANPQDLVIAIDVGGTNDQPTYLEGNTGVAMSQLTIYGSPAEGQQERYRTHRWGKFNTYSYRIPNLTPSTEYRVDLGFAETNLANCAVGKRIFHVALQGSRVLSNFDVYATTGCQTAIVKTFQVNSNGAGQILVSFQKGPVELPYASTIDVYAVTDNTFYPSPAPTPLPTVGPTSAPTLLPTNPPSAMPVPYPTFAPIPAASGPTETTLVFIDVGGNSQDQPGLITGNTGRSVKLSKTIAGTENQVAFRSHRWGKFGSFTYTIPNLVPSLIYRLELGFAEINNANCVVGNRVFDVLVQGVVVESNLDVFSRVGCNAALVLNIPVDVDASGLLTIQMRKGLKEFPYLSSIELIMSTTPNPTFAPTKPPISDSPTSGPTRDVTVPVYTSVAYIDIGSDRNDEIDLLTGSTGINNKPSRTISGADDPTPFRSHRWGKEPEGRFSYSIPDLLSNTNYRVDVGFAETNFNRCFANQRQFHVEIQGARVLENLDVFAEAGCNAALVKTFVAQTDAAGSIQVEFLRGAVELPYASLLHVFAITEGTPRPPSVVLVDAGSNGDRPDWVTGASRVTVKSFDIAGPNGRTISNAEQIPFRTHRWGNGGDFTYTIPNLTPQGSYRVELGFAEATAGNCFPGKRLFNIVIQNQVAFSNVDVFVESGGCRTALVKSHDTTADTSGKIAVTLQKGAIEFPFVSYIDILDLNTGASQQ